MRGLYLHIPFCERKCLYCDFYSLETTHLISRFVDSLVREIELRAKKNWDKTGSEYRGRSFDSVFFGGGTPSLLSAAQLERIIVALSEHFSIEAQTEWTMECNPGTVSKESLSAYRSLGINRLSFGVQSFFDDDLRFLTRIHSPAEALRAVEDARSAGFDNVNIDLMFSLPNQTLDRWKQNLATAVRLETEHLSCYSLIFEEGTPLNAMRLKGEVRPAEEDDDAEFFDYTMNFLADAGYEQYEVSNFARKGRECRHNLHYWEGREYVSFGPSAHGYVNHERYWNARSLERYTKSIDDGELPITNSEILGEKEQMFERAFLELRSKGIRLQEFEENFGIKPELALAPLLEKIKGEDFLRIADGRLSLTKKGYGICDEISAEAIMLLEKWCGREWSSSDIPQESEFE